MPNPNNRFLNRLVSSISTSCLSKKEEKCLAFYKYVIDLERSKEPDIKNYYEYPINYKNERIILIDIPCNKEFTEIFSKNLDSNATKFPCDIYMGLQIKTGDKTYRLLNTVIPFDDIKTIKIDKELLPLPIASLEVNLKESDRLELIPEKIEAINNGVKSDPTMLGLLSLLQKEISQDVKIINTVYLALSTKSIELSQIYSELNNKRLKSSVGSGKLLTQFLSNSPLENSVDNVSTDELLQITELDEYQKEAVAVALNSKVSVITGPPGTGKTQVIENIIANTLLKGKKVLVASKNNKAVDNVKERFDQIDSTGYFLRFGSKQFYNIHTKPELSKIFTEIPRLSDNSTDFRNINADFSKAVQTISDAKSQLNRKVELSKEIPALEEKLATFKSDYDTLLPAHNSYLKNIESQYQDVLQLRDLSVDVLNSSKSSLRIQYNIVESKFTGFFGFWHNWFSKKKYAMILLNTVEAFPVQLKGPIESMKLANKISQFKSFDDMSKYCKTIISSIDRALELKSKIDNENKQYVNRQQACQHKIQETQLSISQKHSELEDLCSKEASIRNNISRCRSWIESNSKKILSIYIKHNKLISNSIQIGNRYQSYLPDSIPWKDIDYLSFIHNAKEFINVFKLCSVTSLSTKNAFPLTEDLFDMVIIDEASQCDVASALPLIMRTKQLVVIGDPMQLKHISAVRVDEENEIKKALKIENCSYIKYADCSLWDYCDTFISNSKNGLNHPVMLQNHYRCHPEIIGYSNEVFYSGKLGCSLNVKTDVSKLVGYPQGLFIVDVKGNQISDNVNINNIEANKAIEIALRAVTSNAKVSVGIVTPFRHQAEKLNSLIPQQYADRIEANTVHKYQGDEKDIMIYSLVITSNSPDKKIKWIDYMVPNLVNVAVTRARAALYVVCNKEYIMAHSNTNNPLGHLVRYKS